MVEIWAQNPMLEMLFGIVSLMGVALLGWSNLMLQPPGPSVKMAAGSTCGRTGITRVCQHRNTNDG